MMPRDGPSAPGASGVLGSLCLPTSTRHQLMVLPFFCGSLTRFRTRPTTNGPVMPEDTISSSFRSKAVRRAAKSCGLRSAGRSTYSRSQLMGTFMLTAPPSQKAGNDTSARPSRAHGSVACAGSQFHSERFGESDVAIEQIAQVSDVVTTGDGAFETDAEGESAVLLRIDATGDQDPRVDDATATPLDPTLAAA